VAWLVKAVISNHLLREIETFKVQIKADADSEIERVKAFLTRASRVHERQLEILAKLYRHLYDARGWFQSMTGTGRTSGEKTREECADLVGKALHSAHDELLQGRLFIPPALVQKCDPFFEAVFEGWQDFSFAHDPMINPVQKSQFWTSAAKVARQDLTNLLQQIEDAARIVVHGEPPSPGTGQKA
jgi:hypothetical protein